MTLDQKAPDFVQFLDEQLKVKGLADLAQEHGVVLAFHDRDGEVQKVYLDVELRHVAAQRPVVQVDSVVKLV
ncbi:MAG: hypothetical protein ACK559_05620, partial [bacterium]